MYTLLKRGGEKLLSSIFLRDECVRNIDKNRSKDFVTPENCEKSRVAHVARLQISPVESSHSHDSGKVVRLHGEKFK